MHQTEKRANTELHEGLKHLERGYDALVKLDHLENKQAIENQLQLLQLRLNTIRSVIEDL